MTTGHCCCLHNCVFAFEDCKLGLQNTTCDKVKTVQSRTNCVFELNLVVSEVSVRGWSLSCKAWKHITCLCVGILPIFSLLFTESHHRRNQVFFSLKLKQTLSTKYNNKSQKEVSIASQKCTWFAKKNLKSEELRIFCTQACLISI